VILLFLYDYIKKMMFDFKKKEFKMKKSFLIVAGIAGLLLSDQPANALVKDDIFVAMGTRSGPTFVINTRPDFVYLSDSGFYVSYGSPYDMLFYGDLYYLYSGGNWYYSSYYNGPWSLIQEFNLPVVIRKHRWVDIRRFRDDEYRRHDRNYWNNQFQFDRQRFGGPGRNGSGQGPAGPPHPPPAHGGPAGQPPPHVNSGPGPVGVNPPPPPPRGKGTPPAPGGKGVGGSPPPAGSGGTPPVHEDRKYDNQPGNGPRDKR
jgi:hypothetical protein